MQAFLTLGYIALGSFSNTLMVLCTQQHLTWSNRPGHSLISQWLHTHISGHYPAKDEKR